MKSILLLLLALSATLPLTAAIDGTLTNGTTNKPQPGITVTLVKPGQGGMKTLGTTTTDASGKFLFTTDQPGGGPQLLQANYKGINYNKLITPNVPTTNVQLPVFESTGSPTVARVAQHMLVMEPNTSQFAVSETVIVQNDSNTTYNNEQLGALRFYLPAAANGQVRVSAQGPGGMPLPRPAEKTEETDTYQVNFPLKPGESQFEISYVLVAGSPLTFHGRVVNVKGMPASPLRLIAPAGVSVAGKDVQMIGTEPKTQATIYNVTARDLFSVDVTGVGSLHNPDDNAGPSDSESPQVTEGKPPIYAQLPWMLTLALSVLGIGLVYLFRTSPVRSPYGK